MVFLDFVSTNPWPKYKCYDYYYRPLFNINANYAFAEKRMLNSAEERIKTAIGAKSGKIIFGGTSSQLIENLMHCDGFSNGVDFWTIGSAYEHDSVDRFLFEHDLHSTKELEEKLKTFDSNGAKPIVFWQGINNVTGYIFPVEEIGKLCKKYGAFFLCDATALVGHTAIPANIDEWCSAFWYSGHKIGTELGIGCMWLSDKFDDWLGDFKLHGTPNLAGALAITDATVGAVKDVKQNVGHWLDLYCYLKRELEENGIEYSNVIGDAKWDEWTSATNAIRLNGINARALQSYLASKQVYVGLGQSSCAEENDNRILNSFGLSDEEANEVVRISFDENSTQEDVTTFVKYVKEFKERYV